MRLWARIAARVASLGRAVAGFFRRPKAQAAPDAYADTLPGVFILGQSWPGMSMRAGPTGALRIRREARTTLNRKRERSRRS